MDDFLNDPLFSNLTLEEKNALKKYSYVRSYDKGQILFYDGDERTRLYYLGEGLIRLENDDPSASFSYIDYVSEGKFFPYGGLFSDKYYRYSAYALTAISVVYIPAKEFESIILNNKDALVDMYTHLSDVLSYHELRVRNSNTSSATDRVIQSLAIWSRDIGQLHPNRTIRIPYPLTITELGRMSGTSRETAGTIIKQLKQEGRIEYASKFLTYIDLEYFESFLN